MTICFSSQVAATAEALLGHLPDDFRRDWHLQLWQELCTYLTTFGGKHSQPHNALAAIRTSTLTTLFASSFTTVGLCLFPQSRLSAKWQQLPKVRATRPGFTSSMTNSCRSAVNERRLCIDCLIMCCFVHTT